MATREISCAEAITEALTEEMERDETVFVIGEDLTAHGGIFGQFVGLPERFPDRIIDTPISEPVVDMHFADFVTTGMDEIVNQMAKIRYMSGGQVTIPMVLWAPDGGGLSAAAQHSQSLESWFIHTPGLKVVVPSEPADVKGLLKAAIRDDDPVIFFQHKLLFARKGVVPEGEYVTPIGSADVKRPGSDITILTYSRMTDLCLEAANKLAGESINPEIIDLRTLKPLDFAMIAESVKKTHNVLIVHEACLTGGFGAEVAARIGEKLFDYLDAPVTRIGAKDVPIPFCPVLENFVLPQVADIVHGVKKVLN
jgi:pyruvate dehydrogenase E1 component beta subunit